MLINFYWAYLRCKYFAYFCPILFYEELILCYSFVQQYLLSSYCLIGIKGANICVLKILFLLILSTIHWPRNIANILKNTHPWIWQGELKKNNEKYFRAISTMPGDFFFFPIYYILILVAVPLLEKEKKIKHLTYIVCRLYVTHFQ